MIIVQTLLVYCWPKVVFNEHELEKLLSPEATVKGIVSNMLVLCTNLEMLNILAEEIVKPYQQLGWRNPLWILFWGLKWVHEQIHIQTILSLFSCADLETQAQLLMFWQVHSHLSWHHHNLCLCVFSTNHITFQISSALRKCLHCHFEIPKT